LAEALRRFRVLYTIHSTGLGKLRLRLGYKPVGRWTVYLPKIGPGYLRALFERGRNKLSPKLPSGLVSVSANVIGRVAQFGGRFRRAESLELAEISDVASIRDEYTQLWREARQEYDLTLDRSLEFLRWRITDNPHLKFRTWTVRKDGQLQAVIIGHRHTLGTAAALYVDDIIVARYTDLAFDAVLSCLASLDPRADAVVIMTLAVDTPLHRALQRRFPLQSWLLKRLGPKLFDEMLALDEEGNASAEPWYVTPIVTEGLDTSL
jgi:hypothetical protein